MKLELQFNTKAINDTSRPRAAMGMASTPPVDEDFWLFRVPVSAKQAVVGFPKMGSIGIGFQVEDCDWNTNLPHDCTAEELYEHIKCNKGDPKISKATCLKAIRMAQAAAFEVMEKSKLAPASTRNTA